MPNFIPSIAIIYKNFAAHKGISHIGLGVSASLNAATLNAKVGPAEVMPATNNIEIVQGITTYNKTHTKPLTHVIISAPWLSTRDLRAMAEHFKNIQFAVLSHSNVGFLQADPNGVRLLRQGLELSQEIPNFRIAGNSRKFIEWMELAYGVPVGLLPNMYPVDHVVNKPVPKHGVIKIGTFGAVRPQKNVLTAAAAAIAIKQEIDRPVEFYISSGRDEGGTQTLMNAMYQLTTNIPGFELKKAPWCTWDKFKDVVASMDLLIQVSYTESFNMVTADGISIGVPSVVSRAIDWAPHDWKANGDDALDVARIGVNLLKNRKLHGEGSKALREHNEEALRNWKNFLGVD